MAVYQLCSGFQREIQFLSNFGVISTKFLSLDPVNYFLKFWRAGQKQFIVLFQSESQGSVNVGHKFVNPWRAFTKVGHFANKLLNIGSFEDSPRGRPFQVEEVLNLLSVFLSNSNS